MSRKRRMHTLITSHITECSQIYDGRKIVPGLKRVFISICSSLSLISELYGETYSDRSLDVCPIVLRYKGCVPREEWMLGGRDKKTHISYVYIGRKQVDPSGDPIVIFVLLPEVDDTVIVDVFTDKSKYLYGSYAPSS